MGMSLQDMEDIETGEFINKLNGFYERERTNQKAEWDRVNYQIYSALLQNPYIERHNKPPTFEAFMKKKQHTNLITTKKALKASPLFANIDLEEK